DAAIQTYAGPTESSIVSMRRLITALLLCVPFLGGVNVRPAVVVVVARAGNRATLAIATSQLTGPALPGGAAMSSLLELGSSAASWRTPTRTSRGVAAPPGDSDSRTARARAERRDHSWLRYGHTLDRARTNVPITYGNPPPVSLT